MIYSVFLRQQSAITDTDLAPNKIDLAYGEIPFAITGGLNGVSARSSWLELPKQAITKARVKEG
jgi:hypothetical protein